MHISKVTLSRLMRNRVLSVAFLKPYFILRFVYFALRENSTWFLRYFPGYHGSTIPSGKFIQENRERLFENATPGGDGVALNLESQKALVDVFAGYQADFSPPKDKNSTSCYFYNNPMYGLGDALVLYCFLRHYKPRRVIEVGSGYSSALLLDVSRTFLPSTELTFIDPYSASIIEVLKNEPDGNFRLIRQPVQNVDRSVFLELAGNDILFVDSSHVLKIGSDLSTLLFSVLPSLRKGVIVHFHDIWYPWEYPEDMFDRGVGYNEAYFLHAFLQFNDAFEIVFFSSYLKGVAGEFLDARLPRLAHGCGQSLWIRKTK